MQRRVLALAVAGCLDFGRTYSTAAADMPVEAPIGPLVAPPAYDWSGPYLGADFGGSWSNGIANIAGAAWDPGATAFIGGFELGYNWQRGDFLVGVEGDFDGSVFARPPALLPTSPGLVQASAHQDWISTLGARFGMTSDKWLVYGKVGGGWARQGATLNFPNGTSWTGANASGGWLLGGGLEYAFKPNWTVKLEYDFLGFDTWTASTVPVVSWSRDVQMIKMGVNYKFDDGTAAATVAPMSATRPETGGDTQSLAKAAQNPIADLISVPFQNNANFGVGPFNRTQDVLNIEPVVPMHLGNDWIVISRTIVPLTSQPDAVFDSSTYGIGDTSESLILSPADSGIKDFSWGFGPILTAPTASDAILGTGKLLLGPEAVIIYTPGHWVLGALASNSWSIAGDPLRNSVNFFSAQPFINYNIPDGQGWYLVTSPIITADWMAPSSQRWTVPVGGGVGRVFKAAGQAFNASAQVFYNVERSDSTPGNWQFRFQVALLFPQ
jgi:opacity protein-like surface antigen